MKTLSVLRHAKSSWDDSGLDDFDRPLNDRGIEAARKMGRECKRRRMRFDLVLASPAVRVRETLEEFAKGFGAPPAVRFEQQIYLAAAEELLDLVRAIPEEAGAPLLVGHNPGLQRLLVTLCEDDRRGLRHRVAEKFPTAAVAVVRIPLKRWRDIAPGAGEIAELILPCELD
jgi:phosphohistidine phosphatase